MTGQEVLFNGQASSTPFDPPSQITTSSCRKWRTSAQWRVPLAVGLPIAPPGTPFPPGFTDLQSWTRDMMLDPDWLRIGQDIVGGNPFPTFNAAFSLDGVATPLPGALPLFATGLGVHWVCSAGVGSGRLPPELKHRIEF